MSTIFTKKVWVDARRHQNRKDHFGPQHIFSEVSALLDVTHCPKLQPCAISRKTNDATLRKWLKLNFRPNLGPPFFFFFSWVLNLLVLRQCSKLSTFVISRKTKEPNLKKWQNLVLGLILVHFNQIWTPQIFCRFYLY